MTLSKQAFIRGFLEAISVCGYDRVGFEKVAEIAWVKNAKATSQPPPVLPQIPGGQSSWMNWVPFGASIMFPMMADTGEKLEQLEQERFAMEDELKRRKRKQALLEAQRRGI
jgi:hypothetical protein